MRKTFLLILFSFLISNISYSEEKTLHCKFVGGDLVEFIQDGKNRTIYGAGDKEDEYIVIDFEKEKIKSAPYYVNKFLTYPLFQADEVGWDRRKKNEFSYSVRLNRKNGRLWIIYNQLPTEPGVFSWEYNYDCEDAKLKF